MDRTAKNSTFWSAYSFVWSDVRKSFLYIGGFDSGIGSPNFYEFKIGRLSPWSTLSSSGSVPPPIAGSCMVPAYSGTKMLFFGGSDAISQAPIDTLYILDVPTMTWSQGAKYQPRLGMVCSVSGDYLIVWGGKGISVSSGDAGRLIPTDEALIIYSIKTAQWTTQFVDKTSSDNSIKKAAINKKAVIIGGSVSAAVVIILIVGVVVFRKRHHHFQQQKQEVNVSSPLQVIPEQDIEEEPMEKMYFRDNQPRLAGAITSQQSIQKTQPVRITPPKSTHSNSPQYIYAHGPQQDHLDPPSWRTSLSPSQRVRSVSSSRSSSTLVATPTMSASPRYPSRQHQNRSPQQQQRQSITHDPPTRRSMRNPQGRNTPVPTSNSNHSIQYQLDALHAEATRLQAMLNS
ncbi:MAG: hypothetical protein JOS17DRAFT_753407 [Linnemannia elongata]|nr:MAG: hypothetical protein JOS17DRAFT_753407 [Linnemannia elongata]